MMKVGDRATVVKTYAAHEEHFIGETGTVRNVHTFIGEGDEVYQLKMDSGGIAEFYADEVRPGVESTFDDDLQAMPSDDAEVYQNIVDSLSQAIANKAEQMTAGPFVTQESVIESDVEQVTLAFPIWGEEGSHIVNSPAHYVNSAIEPIDYMADKLPAYNDGHTAFCVGNVIKYVSRAPHKGKLIEDLEKAAKYLEFAIKHEKGKL